MDNIFTKINNLYNKKGFLARYGLDMWTSALIILTFFITTAYFYILNHIQPIKANWSKERCNPAVIPFAGLIQGKSGKDSFEFTGENFTGCIQTIFQNIAGYALQPINYSMNVLNETTGEVRTSTNAIRAMINKIRNSTKEFSEEIMGRSLNVTIPLIKMVIAARDVMGKTTGTMTAALYTLFGSYLGLKSLMGAIMQFVLIILLIMAALIVVSWIAGFFFPPADIIAISTTAMMVALLIPYIIVEVFLNRVMDLPIPSPPGVPSKPSCFSGKTVVNLKNKEKKQFEDLEIGDQLWDGSTITAVLKLSSAGQEMYKLNGLFVSGTHRVYHEDMEWITVNKHPQSILIDDFREPYIYCLNTNTKTIKLANNTFLDWDELDEMNLTDLRFNCIKQGFLPRDFKNSDIHRYLGVGIHEDMDIELEDGKSISIKDVEVNDILRFGEQVYGIVKIDTSKLKGVYEYYLEDGKKIKSSKHILIKDSDLGTINTGNLSGFQIEKPKYLYHLLTNMGTYVVNGIRIKTIYIWLSEVVNKNTLWMFINGNPFHIFMIYAVGARYK